MKKLNMDDLVTVRAILRVPGQHDLVVLAPMQLRFALQAGYTIMEVA